MVDTGALRLIGLAFAIVTLVVTATAAMVANVEVERLDVQSSRIAESFVEFPVPTRNGHGLQSYPI